MEYQLFTTALTGTSPGERVPQYHNYFHTTSGIIPLHFAQQTVNMRRTDWMRTSTCACRPE